MHRAGLTEVNRRNVVGVDLLPAIQVVEQDVRGAPRPHQRRLDVVFFQQTKKNLRLHQAAGGVVVDEEFFAIEFGAPVDEGATPLAEQMPPKS